MTERKPRTWKSRQWRQRIREILANHAADQDVDPSHAIPTPLQVAHGERERVRRQQDRPNSDFHMGLG